MNVSGSKQGSPKIRIKFEEYSASSATAFPLTLFLPLCQSQTCQVPGTAGFKDLPVLLGSYGTGEFDCGPAKMHVQHPAKTAGPQCGWVHAWRVVCGCLMEEELV